MKAREQVPGTRYFASDADGANALDGAKSLRVLVNSLEIGGNYQSEVVEA
jgi:hypothetical protein